MIENGILLINLGTPDQPDVSSVKKYLKQFLSDPRVIDIPAAMRWLLLHLVILPFRPKQSSEAYQQVWTRDGSPLLVHGRALQQALAEKLGNSCQVELGMRYGNPSIASALQKLSVCKNIKIIPLFPQYSSAATGSAIAEVLRLVGQQWNIANIWVKNAFYADPKFITAYASIIQNSLDMAQPDMVLFSYHGLPERHIKKSNCTANCDLHSPCPVIDQKNAYCYRAQCYETSRLLAVQLNLSTNQYKVTFQSRLGRTPWIMPYTDHVLTKLSKKNIKNIVIACPSFVADCLETLEEIGIRAKQQWQKLGGKQLTLVPCLNANSIWIDALVAMIGNME